MERSEVRIGQRVRLVLPSGRGPGTRHHWFSGTVAAIDEPLTLGVRVRLDRIVNGVDNCYATYAELEEVSPQVSTPRG